MVVAALAVCTVSVSVGLITGSVLDDILALKNIVNNSPPDQHSFIDIIDLNTYKFSATLICYLGIMTILAQPTACLTSGLVQDIAGRRTCLIIALALFSVSWTILIFSRSTELLFYGVALMGLFVNFVSVPIMCYMTEMSQTKLRGVFCCLPTVFQNFGKFLTNRRELEPSHEIPSIVGMIVSLAGLGMVLKIPESPAWLVTKGRSEKAKKSYQWLRGWVRQEDIQKEYDEQVLFAKQAQGHVEEDSGSESCKRLLQLLLQPEVRTAFCVIIIYMTVADVLTLTTMTSYFDEIAKDSKNELKDVQAITNGLTVIGACIMTLCTTTLGRRGLTFVSLGLCTLCSLGLWIYYFWFHTEESLPTIPVALYLFSNYCGYLGIVNIPWILLAELFPIRVRGVVGGLCYATKYTLDILMDYVSPGIVSGVSDCRVYFAHVIVGLLGCFYLYHNLPETESKTMKVIQRDLTVRCSRRRTRSRNRSRKYTTKLTNSRQRELSGGVEQVPQSPGTSRGEVLSMSTINS